MGESSDGRLPAGLARARDRFRTWRRTHKRRSRLPEPLWTLAVGLTDAHGLHRTASVLGLDYYSLQKRVAAADAERPTPRPAFIELPPAVPAGRQCVLEFEDGTGRSMRVHLNGYDAPDVATLSRSFWNAE
jgi:hypothetical protein